MTPQDIEAQKKKEERKLRRKGGLKSERQQ